MSKYVRRGIAGYFWLPSVANVSAPTAAEIAAGTDLTPAVVGITGFKISTEMADGSTAESRFPSQVRGVQSLDDSSIDFIDDDVDDALRALLADGEDGFLLFSPYDMTPDTGDTVEIWVVQSSGMNRNWDAIGNNVATQTCPYAITAPGDTDAVVAA